MKLRKEIHLRMTSFYRLFQKKSMVSRQFFKMNGEKEVDFVDFVQCAEVRSFREAVGIPLHFVRDLVK